MNNSEEKWQSSICVAANRAYGPKLHFTY